MHLIADSGSTKTDWRIVSNPEFKQVTNGLNPMVAPVDFIDAEIKNISQSLSEYDITKVTFYGAGCSKSESKDTMCGILKKYFSSAKITVDTDLIGAAQSLFHNSKGIVAILGTGCNAAYYDGKILQCEVPSLGYLLGDDGAGVGIGRALLKQYLYGTNNWKLLLEQEALPTDKKVIVQQLYASPTPNKYIANFAQAALKNTKNQFVKDLVVDQFNLFITDMVLPNTASSRDIGFVGSIAFYAQDLLHEVCKIHQLNLTKVIKQPIDGIVKHHIK